MKKAEIIAATMRQANEAGAETVEWTGPKTSYAEYLLATLKEKFSQLHEDAEVLTCVNFRHVGEEFCPVCHDEYLDELEIIQFRPGSFAWI